MSATYDIEDFSQFRFDEFLNLSADHRRAASDALKPTCDAGRTRARSAASANKFERTLGLVLANALAARDAPNGPACYYSRGRTTYSARGSYNPPWLAYRVLIDGVINPLLAARLLRGRTSRPTGLGDAPRSTYQASDELVAGLETLGITAANVTRDPALAPVLILKGPQKDGQKPWLDYIRNAADVLALDRPVRAYNNFLAEQELAWNPPEDVRRAVLQRRDDNGRLLQEPQLASCRLRRIYNEGRWDRGGRFYGGWWQLLPSVARRYIHINGEPVVELDFGGFLPTAIYHLEGLSLDDDAYEIPEIREQAEARGNDWEGEVRPSIKKMFAVILNSTTRAGRQYVQGIKLPRGLSKTRAYELIEQHHQAIGDWFYKGRGIELMNDESNLCQSILSAGVTDNVVVLPVHDSFVVAEGQEDWLRQRMIEAYQDRFGFPPLIH